MKVKYAAQVFSRSVYLAMQAFIAFNELLPTAVDAAEFVERMDDLFDTVNSSCVRIRERKMRHAMSPSTAHVQFLNSCFSWFQSWKFESGSQPRTIRGWQVTVRAIVLLWAELQASFGFQFLLTRNLNQDLLENLFGIVRQQHGCNETPNAYQFAAGLKHIVVGKLFKLSDNSNCEQDKSVLLTELKRLLSDVAGQGQSQSTASTSLDVPEHLSETDLPSLDVLEANIVCYVSGYLVHTFLKSKACDSCRQLLKSPSQDLASSNQVFMMFKAVEIEGRTLGNLAVPTEMAFHHVARLEQLFSVAINDVAHKEWVS
ncbi:hypothetical protein HPB48_026058 [Haemaphysalis longicornis]|uniref:Transposable element n=1 Tax=Haemaphysalis longicornis TaxID=44386 RepID=A0A9J6H8P4_HAELO|nr:hypothetical protein HPB48_026058 [Haemaphysalis longicornis]